jgi:ketosteroid isomerase-like protein
VGETALELVRGVYESHKVRNTPGLLDLLSEDIEWHQAQGHPYAGPCPWRGHDEVVRQVVEPINGDWDGFITQVDEFIDAGDKIVVLGRYTGMYKATGRAIDASVCVIYTVRSGRIVKFQQYTDTAQIRAAMDLDPPVVLPGAAGAE